MIASQYYCHFMPWENMFHKMFQHVYAAFPFLSFLLNYFLFSSVCLDSPCYLRAGALKYLFMLMYEFKLMLLL